MAFHPWLMPMIRLGRSVWRITWAVIGLPRAVARGLVALIQLPAEIHAWRQELAQQSSQIRELTDVLQTLLVAIGTEAFPTEPSSELPVSVPLSPSADPPFLHRALGPPPPPLQPSPTRLRTAEDVTYSSRAILRSNDDAVDRAQAPWRGR